MPELFQDSPERAHAMRRATLRLGLVYWPALFVADSIMGIFININPLESAALKLVLYGFSALMTFGMAVLLFRARGLSFIWQTLLCFVLAGIAAPLFALLDFVNYKLCHPDIARFDPTTFGFTLIYGASVFFGWSCLYVALNYSFEVRDRDRRLAAVREEALSAQMRALRYQVSPHFLFNTLNSIAGLIEEGASKRAEQMVLSLSTFLRTTLTLDPLHDVPLAEEMALQEEYLEIERERFSDRMTLSIAVADDVREALVPSLILQPLIENALKHGVNATVGQVGITLNARSLNGRLNIVIDNDMPEQPSPNTGTGIGLKNVAERLRARFQDDGLFSSGANGPGRYRASIDLPLRFA
ncbi:MAG: histidine kinase [Pseudomonadota bacterium]